MPRVSVLLTCYNHIDYVAAALESVRSQSFRDYKIIAIDDGSTDGTREWLERNAKDVRIILNERNLGTYGSLNVALSNAEGEFIAILNDDDVWKHNKLERQVALLNENPKIGLVHTDGRFIDKAGKEIEGSPLGFEFPRTETGDVLIPLIYANKIIASSVLIRRQCFDQLGAFDPAYFGSGDWQMWLRIAEAWQIGYVNEQLTEYRVHGTNASHMLDKIWQDDQVLREWIESKFNTYFESERDSIELQAARAHNWACLGTVRTLNGDQRGGRMAYRESWRIAPWRWKSRLRWLATFLPRQWFRKLN